MVKLIMDAEQLRNRADAANCTFDIENIEQTYVRSKLLACINAATAKGNDSVVVSFYVPMSKNAFQGILAYIAAEFSQYGIFVKADTINNGFVDVTISINEIKERKTALEIIKSWFIDKFNKLKACTSKS